MDERGGKMELDAVFAVLFVVVTVGRVKGRIAYIGHDGYHATDGNATGAGVGGCPAVRTTIGSRIGTGATQRVRRDTTGVTSLEMIGLLMLLLAVVERKERI